MLLVSLLSAAPGTLVLVLASRWRTSRVRVGNNEEIRAKVLEAAGFIRRRNREIRGEPRAAARREAPGARTAGDLPSGKFLNCRLMPTVPRFPAMGDESNRRRRCRRREAEEPKAGFAVVAYPADAKIGIKQVAYLHAYCGLQPHLIAAKCPKVLTLSDVHLALAHYFRDPASIDAELKREFAFNARDGLGSPSMCMPRRDADSD